MTLLPRGCRGWWVQARRGWIGLVRAFGGGAPGGCCSFGRGRLRTEEWCAPVAFLSAQGHLVDADGSAACRQKPEHILFFI